MIKNRRNRKRVNNKKNKNKIIIIILIIILLILLFSVIFSIFNIGNNKIIKGIKIEKIDISNLSQEEATKKIEEYYNDLINSKITLKYEELEKDIQIQELEPKIEINNLIQKAVSVGKSGNIIKDNYDILFTKIFKKNIELNININEEKINKLIEEINENIPNALEESNYYIENNNLIITKGKSGVKVDENKFKNEINNAIKNKIETVEIATKNENPKEINIEEIYKEIYKDKKDAYISQNPIKVEPEVNGIDFAISMDEAKKILEENKNEYIIPLKISIPEVTLAKLGKEAFPNKLGTFTTRYDASNKNRSTNLELASEKINGTIILPGETFSYNKIVGERTIEQGYKEAAVYSGGKVIDGIGGGICQLSSTLYNAVIYANLEVTSRSNHHFLTSYVTAGRDATVSWGTIDFCFKNNRTYPIKIISIVKNGVATVDIMGINEEKEYEVVIETTIKEVIPYEIKYVKDSNMKDGEEIKQYGADGAKSITYKILKYNGIVVSKTVLSEDIYSALDRIIKTGKENSEVISTSGILIDKEQLNELNPELLNNIKELN